MFTFQPTPQRDLVLTNTDSTIIFKADSKTIISKSKLLASIVELPDECKADDDRTVVVDMFTPQVIELLQLMHHDIQVLSNLKTNASIIEYINAAEFLQLHKDFVLVLVDKLLTSDIDLTDIIKHQGVLKPYFRYSPQSNSLSSKIMQIVKLEKIPLDVITHLLPSMSPKDVMGLYESRNNLDLTDYCPLGIDVYDLDFISKGIRYKAWKLNPILQAQIDKFFLRSTRPNTIEEILGSTIVTGLCYYQITTTPPSNITEVVFNSKILMKFGIRNNGGKIVNIPEGIQYYATPIPKRLQILRTYLLNMIPTLDGSYTLPDYLQSKLLATQLHFTNTLVNDFITTISDLRCTPAYLQHHLISLKSELSLFDHNNCDLLTHCLRMIGDDHLTVIVSDILQFIRRRPPTHSPEFKRIFPRRHY